MAATSTDTGDRPLHPVARELAASTGFLLARLGVAFRGTAVVAVDDAGFEIHDYPVLAILGEADRETQATIADAIGLDPSRLVALLDSLERRDLVVRARDPHDRRRHVVRITAAGRVELGRLRALAGRIEEAFFEPLADGERAALHELLVRLAERHDPRCCPLDDPDC